MNGPVRVFVRLVSPDGSVVDAVGYCEQAVIHQEAEALDRFSMQSMLEYDRQGKPRPFRPLNKIWLRFHDELYLETYRVSNEGAEVNWQTDPGEIPAAEQVMLGHARNPE